MRVSVAAKRRAQNDDIRRKNGLSVSKGLIASGRRDRVAQAPRLASNPSARAASLSLLSVSVCSGFVLYRSLAWRASKVNGLYVKRFAWSITLDILILRCIFRAVCAGEPAEAVTREAEDVGTTEQRYRDVVRELTTQYRRERLAMPVFEPLPLTPFTFQ